jgi:hypothetical protein
MTARGKRPDEDCNDYLNSLGVPPITAGGFKDLGTTPLVRQLGLSTEQTNGHWCSRCQGIWFGHALEVECPVCGNRSG